MAISNASAQWTGGFKDGKGAMKPAHAPGGRVHALASRFEGAEQQPPRSSSVRPWRAASRWRSPSASNRQD